MPYTIAEKRKALLRVRKLQGQLAGLARMLEAEADCSEVLQQIAAIRGAVNGLMGSVLESHVRESTATGKERAMAPVVALIRSYLK